MKAHNLIKNRHTNADIVLRSLQKVLIEPLFYGKTPVAAFALRLLSICYALQTGNCRIREQGSLAICL